jgi:dihydroorotate dehydrogenase
MANYERVFTSPPGREKMIDKTYRLIYDNLLSRLPEGIGVPLGRIGFSLLPLKALGKYLDSAGYEQEVILGGKSGQESLAMRYPAILASCYYQYRILRNMDYLGFGAITTKTITLEGRKGNPGRKILRDGKTFYNSDGHKNPGLKEFLKILERLKGDGMETPLIVSISGEDEKAYSILARELSEYADAIEISTGCVNTDYGCNFSEPEMASRLFGYVRESTDKPLIVKPARDSDLDGVAESAIENGIDIINHGNTELVERPEFERGIAGKSGPELYRDTISDVRRLNELYGDYVDIIACGGINSGKRAIKARNSGASAVEVLSGLITEGSSLVREINRSLLGLP